MFEFLKADARKFATFHTIYAPNIFQRFDWNEMVDDAINCISDRDAYFVYSDANVLGGFVLKGNNLSYPFTVATFDNRSGFWGAVLTYAANTSEENEIFLNEIPEADTQVLTQLHGAKLKWSKQRMIRPTERYVPVLGDNFYFCELVEADKAEIIKVIYAASAAGYTSTVWEPNIAEIETAVGRRLASFGQTKTLFMSNVVKCKANNEIVGVCIAGVYPDAENYSTKNFATIHQVSVIPKYQRQGIAKAMMLKAISDAIISSPVITLGVLVGNPAELLYKKIGFMAGPRYSELVYYV